MDLEEKLIQVVPSKRQLIWQQNEFTAFIHFGMNTFTGKEWGDGGDAPEVFAPAALDTDQWCAALKSAGIKACLLTAKHHDGFCLWDTKQTDYNVMGSSFPQDIVRMMSDSCKKYGIKMGVYLSPWDRHEPFYGQGEAYNDFFCEQLTELLTGYGELYCLWFDGACGEGPNGQKQPYDWSRYYQLIRRYQPDAVISICGPDVRWCGNEAGSCRSSEWSVVSSRLQDVEKIHDNSQQTDNASFREAPLKSEDEDLGSQEILTGEEGLIWYPAEVDVSIRPGWFYHQEEDDKVKSLKKLMHIYRQSVGGNTVLLLNIPPDKRGLIHENDVRRLEEMGEVLRLFYNSSVLAGAVVTAQNQAKGHEIMNALSADEDYWTTEDGIAQAEILIEFQQQTEVGSVILQEQIRESQRIEAFSLWAFEGEQFKQIFTGTTVGYKKICSFPKVNTKCLKILIERSRKSPTLKTVDVFSKECSHEIYQS